MGWSFYASYGRDTVELLQREISASADAPFTYRWVDHAKVGSTVYAVVEKRYKPDAEWQPDGVYVNDPDGAYRFVVVFLTSRRGRDGYDFGYKIVEETMGPVEDQIPERLLQLASPFRETYTGYGRDWRDRVRESRKLRRTARKAAPKVGQVFKTEKPVKFTNGTEHDTFKVVENVRRGKKRKVYQSLTDGWSYRFNPARYGFEVIQ
jgi:hypothetical protein